LTACADNESVFQCGGAANQREQAPKQQGHRRSGECRLPWPACSQPIADEPARNQHCGRHPRGDHPHEIQLVDEADQEGRAQQYEPVHAAGLQPAPQCNQRQHAHEQRDHLRTPVEAGVVEEHRVGRQQREKQCGPGPAKLAPHERPEHQHCHRSEQDRRQAHRPDVDAEGREQRRMQPGLDRADVAQRLHQRQAAQLHRDCGVDVALAEHTQRNRDEDHLVVVVAGLVEGHGRQRQENGDERDRHCVTE
jgi:hypothetical protein